MAELDELENRLTALRHELAVMSREGCTPTQFLKLQRDLVRAWAAVEECKSSRMPVRLPTGAGAAAADARDATGQDDRGRNRG